MTMSEWVDVLEADLAAAVASPHGMGALEQTTEEHIRLIFAGTIRYLRNKLVEDGLADAQIVPVGGD